MTTLHDADAHEPAHKSSATARVIEELELYGYQPSAHEPDPRALPDTDRLEGAISDMFDILAGTLRDTRLDTDLDDLLWSPHRSLPQESRPRSAPARRQRRPAEALAARAGRLRNPLGRTRNPHRPGPSPPRAPRSLRADPRFSPPSAMRPRPAQPGVPARAASSTTGT